MYLVHHKKDGVYASISLSVYPEGPHMDLSQLILKCQLVSIPVITWSPKQMKWINAVRSNLMLPESYTVPLLARGQLTPD